MKREIKGLKEEFLQQDKEMRAVEGKVSTLELELQTTQAKSQQKERREQRYVKLLDKELVGTEAKLDYVEDKVLNLEEEELAAAAAAESEDKVSALEKALEKIQKETIYKEHRKALEENISSLEEENLSLSKQLEAQKTQASPQTKKSQQEYEQEAREKLLEWQKVIVLHLDSNKCEIVMDLYKEAKKWKQNHPGDYSYKGLDYITQDEKDINFLKNLSRDSQDEIIKNMDNDKCNIIDHMYAVAMLYNTSLLKIQDSACDNTLYTENSTQSHNSLPFKINDKEKAPFLSLQPVVDEAREEGTKQQDTRRGDRDSAYSSDDENDTNESPQNTVTGAIQATGINDGSKKYNKQ